LLVVNETLYVPGTLYETTGFCNVEVEGVPPEKDQFHAVGDNREASVKIIGEPTQATVSCA
jgi:hypothetical protein